MARTTCSCVGFVVLSLVVTFASASEITYDGAGLKIDGERKLIISGSIHYPRSAPLMWPYLIEKAKSGGLNAIETYVFWNAHEPSPRQYEFSGNLDLVGFIKTIQYAGLYVILRIGPYVCAEWNYGGFPMWLHHLPNITFRTHNEMFKNEMKIFTKFVVQMMKNEKLFASQGGPIILAQIENEYGNIVDKYGEEGKKYVKWCAKFAQSLNIGVPWIMCQQSDAPQPMINTCNGFYCEDFTPNNPNSPKMWSENWTGWFKGWGKPHPHRPAEDLAFAVARFFQYGGSLMNYYMYHGGTNFGRTSGGPYITTSYDYDAPLDEYGNLNQPKWGHLKELHHVLLSMEKTLLNGVRRDVDYGHSVTATVYSYQGKSVCFLGNKNSTTAFTIDFEHTNYTIPAWSVSVLPDCFTEAHNTAKVNSQISIMVKKPNDADNAGKPNSLKWSWRREEFLDIVNGNVNVSSIDLTANQLLDQKDVTNDTTDYLWCFTSFDVDEKDPLVGKNVTLSVHTSGEVIHGFLNSKHLGTQWSKTDYERSVTLTPGINNLTLLSATVGLQNYGAYFDINPNGILGPVKFIDNSTNTIRNISSNQWRYKVGMRGQKLQFYNPSNFEFHGYQWRSDALPTNVMYVWYKTTFKSPRGEVPVVVDLFGMGKGEAWVNGNSIGRYWASYLSTKDGCDVCNYNGTYGDSKCRTNCGEPSQRWYHIPREFLQEEGNDLVLFEELGGTPNLVNIQTVTIGKACAEVYEGRKLELSCQGRQRFSDIKFASFGDPQGTCGSFRVGSCESVKASSVIKEACLGKERCSIPVSEMILGTTGCHSTKNRLAVEAIC